MTVREHLPTVLFGIGELGVMFAIGVYYATPSLHAPVLDFVGFRATSPVHAEWTADALMITGVICAAIGVLVVRRREKGND